MLDRIFDIDNPVMRFLSILCDLMIINLITIVLCIPVITAVPALTAVHYITLKMVRGEASYIVRPYFKSFKENFKQSFLIGLILLVVGTVLYADLRLTWSAENNIPQLMRVVVSGAAIIICLLLMWVIPLQAHFENTIRGTFRNAVLMSLANFPRSLLMLMIWLIPIVIVLSSYALWPMIILFGISAPAYVCAIVYSPAFKRFEPEPEEERPDEMFSMDEADLDAFSQELASTLGRDETPDDES